MQSIRKREGPAQIATEVKVEVGLVTPKETLGTPFKSYPNRVGINKTKQQV